ncbi:hypothetical protein Tco_0960680 [Tanacetum coccineum]
MTQPGIGDIHEWFFHNYRRLNYPQGYAKESTSEIVTAQPYLGNYAAISSVPFVNLTTPLGGSWSLFGNFIKGFLSTTCDSLGSMIELISSTIMKSKDFSICTCPMLHGTLRFDGHPSMMMGFLRNIEGIGPYIRRGKVYNWETATYGKIWYDEDVHDLRSVETEFPAIVFNDALTSEVTLSCEPTTEPTISSQPIDEFDLNDENSLSECDEEEQNVLYFNDLFPFNVIYLNDSKSDKDNDDDDDKIDIKQSSGGNVKNTDDGAYAHWSNKLLETSHDTSNKFFKTKTFIKELNVNIVAWNYLNNGMLLNLIKNLYVPFGIPFDPKLFYKDGIKLGQV